MTYNTSPTLEKQTCTDYVDFGKCQDIFGQFSWTINDSNYLDFKLNVFKKESKDTELRLSEHFATGETDFVAADNFLRGQNLSPVLQSTLSKDMEE